jgi:hypothetical protein
VTIAVAAGGVACAATALTAQSGVASSSKGRMDRLKNGIMKTLPGKIYPMPAAIGKSIARMARKIKPIMQKWQV